MNGTATLTKLVCVRSQKRTLAEQEIPELSRVCSAIIYYFACCAHSEHTTNVCHLITLVLDPLKYLSSVTVTV